MSFRFVEYEKRDHVAYVTLNRPERLNALHYPAHKELNAIFRDFADDPQIWVGVITGSGTRAFSAGHDLREPVDPGQERVAFGGITRDFDCAKPLIAAVNGLAVGGGFEIALACDIIIASDSARFGLAEPRVGLIAGAGGIHRLARQVPSKLAMGLLLTGRLISAEEAHRIGAVNEVVPAAALDEAVERWISEILACSPLSVQLTKEAARDGELFALDEALARDAPRLERLLASEDFREGTAAFRGKRDPIWRGV